MLTAHTVDTAPYAIYSSKTAMGVALSPSMPEPRCRIRPT